MGLILRKLFKWLVYTAAGGVMVLALLVGIARLFLPLVPEYQDDIRRWAGDATGFNVQFERISASWPLAGPEVRFLDVTVSSRDDGQPILVTEELTVSISLLRLIRDQQIAVGRIGVSGTRIEVLRDSEGRLYFQDRTLDQLLANVPARDGRAQLPNLTLVVANIGVGYIDQQRNIERLESRIEQLEIELTPDGLSLDGDIELPRSLGALMTISADAPADLLLGQAGPNRTGAEDDGPLWNVYLAASELDVAKVLELGLAMPTPLESASGSFIVWASIAGNRPRGVTVEVDLANIRLRSSPDVVADYDSLRGQIEWEGIKSGWVLGGTDIQVERNELQSPVSQFSVLFRPDSAAGRQVVAKAQFMRLHDWYPIVRAVVAEDIRDTLLPDELRGDVRDLRLDLLLVDEGSPEFNVELSLDDFTVLGWPTGESISNVSGSVVADQAGGRLQLDSRDVAIDLPKVFLRPLEAESIEGLMVWRVAHDSIRVLSDNIEIQTSIARASSRFELSFPGNGESPYLDLIGHAESSNAQGTLSYLPMRRFPDAVVNWLERAIVSGRATGADIEVRGPLRAFPFDRDEGKFHIAIEVVDGVLDAAPGWPRIRNITGELVFDGLGLYSRRNSGNFGTVPFVNADVKIADLQKGVVEVRSSQSVDFDNGLGLLRASPLAQVIGPTIERIEGRGRFDTDLRLTLPIQQLEDYRLDIGLATNDTDITLTRLGFGLTKLTGSLRVENTKFYAEDLTAQLLDEPVTITLQPSVDPAEHYSQFATVSGATPVQSWIAALNLPLAENFSGRANWKAMALFPGKGDDGERNPLHLLVRSDLRGVESVLPAPVSKAPDTASALELDISFSSDDALEVNGRLARELTWALRLEAQETTAGSSWVIERGGIHSGAAAASLPLEPGIELSGRVKMLRFDDWLALGSGAGDAGFTELYSGADLTIERFSLLGQYFPDVRLDARRGSQDWEIEFDSAHLAGTVRVPFKQGNGWPLVLDLERLWMLEPDDSESSPGDPRNAPSASIHIGDFALGDMRFGSLDAELVAMSSGLIVEPLRMQSETFSINGDAAWLVHPNDDSLQQSKLRLSLRGTDIRTLLTELGYDPVIEGKSVEATADLTWLGPPAADLLSRADGTFGMQMKNGAVLSLEPGGGRLLGILSVTALPRRLALDFRDVVDEGLSFERLKGDFTVDDGNAYTCNLSLEGSVADMGVVGRTGIETEDYDQLAVVRPHVSNLFAIGGAVVGGPAVGAAMLLFSQIFRDPLSQLGESYYRVTGGWDEPEIRQIQGSEFDLTPLKNCEEYLATSVTESLKE